MAQSISQEAIIATGLPGATASTRYAGATSSGAPTSGTFAVGDMVTDQTGYVYVCTTAGTPGSWSLIGGRPPFVSGNWYPVPENVFTYSMTNGMITTTPFVVQRTHSFSAIGCNVSTTPGSSGSVARLGIYYDNGSCFPGTLLADYGTVATTTSGAVVSITISGGVTLQPGLYWLAYVAQGSPATNPTMWGSTPNAIGGMSTLNVQSYYFGSSGGWVTTASTYTGALPSTFPSGAVVGQTATTTIPALVALKA